jgi:hypothetical protein
MTLIFVLYILAKISAMKTFLLLMFIGSSVLLQAQTAKSKNLKLKYTLPAGWNILEFGGKSPWEEGSNNLCKCSGILFFKSHKDGKMNVLVYPSTQAGLDSTKREFVGNLHFETVEKYDGVRSNGLSYERKRSNFFDTKTTSKSFDVYRFFAKVDDHFVIIYAWQENMRLLNSTNEKELLEMVRAIEPY